MRRVVLVGLVYFVISFISVALTKGAVTEQVVFVWRLSAWTVSAVVYAAHIAYEHFWLHNSTNVLARNVAVAVAIGGFLLAVGALVNAVLTPRHPPIWLYFIALVSWPIFTGAPAYAVAFIVGKLLDRFSRR
ncbi:MAG TPA: hypothetical protein VGW58_09125 [Pyrinomonadaceae bacterium]|nr:hypothetical protein [Pyrinomonadaceae bacterium]